ncbi:MAG: DUF3096 domain-containing protein [Thioploca sp.]|nr:DUF3096 domain-containing protein [Thioploca sp.]
MKLPPTIEPIVAIIAGILILAQPQLLSYIVAIYLIVVGILQLTQATKLF